MTKLLINICTFLLVSTLILTEQAFAQDDDNTAQAYESMAVQNRLYLPTSEFSFFLGILPMDAFKKGLTLSGAYTHHFSELWAWEVVHFYFSFPVETNLHDDLKALEIEELPFEIVEQFFTSNLVIKPIYWKGSWLNDSLVYGELMLLGGLGYGWFTRSQRVAVDLGLAMRVFISQLFSVRIDVIHHAFFNDSIFEEFDLHHELWIGIGASLLF